MPQTKRLSGLAATSLSPTSSSVSASPRLKASSCASLPASRSRGHSETIRRKLLQAAVGVALDPELDGPEPCPLARAGTRRHLLRARQVASGRGLTLRRIHREDQTRRHEREHQALFLAVGGGHEVGEPLAEAQPFLRHKIERGDRALVRIAQLQPLPVRAPRLFPRVYGERVSHAVARVVEGLALLRPVADTHAKQDEEEPSGRKS